MYRSRRSRCREEPLVAAEFGRDRVWMSPAPPEGQFRIRKRPNASRIASDSACNIGFSAEENSFTVETRQSSSKKASGIPIKELTDEEELKEEETMFPSPSLIGRLMGLDTLPSTVRQQKYMDGCQTTSSIGFSGNYVHPVDCSHQMSTSEDQEFIDVFEVTETSKIKKRRNYSNSRGMLSCRGNETDMDLVRQKFMATKCFSNYEVLQNSKECNDAFEDPDSSKDLFLEFLQDPNSLFAKHLQDLNHARSSPHRSKIPTLRPSKGTKHWSSEVQCKSSKSESNPDRCSYMQQEVTGSFKMDVASTNKHYIEENSGFHSNNTSASQHLGRTEVCVHPAHIVILKPNLERAQKMAEADFFTHENFGFCSKRYREIAATGIQELHGDGRNKTKLSCHAEVLNHKAKGSREIAREITREMRHAISSHTKNNFTSEINPHDVTGDSFSLPCIHKINHSEATCWSPDHFGEWNKGFSPSSSYSTTTSMSREARKRLSERWKITHQFQNLGLNPRGPSTLGAILALSDRESPKVTMDMLNTKNVSDEKLVRGKGLGIKGFPLVNSSKDGWKDGSSRFLPRSRSLPASRSAELSDRKQDGGSSKTMIKDDRELQPTVSSDAKFSKPGIALVKSSKHHTHISRRTHSIVEENMLPEWEIHVNSEGLRKSNHLRYSLDKATLHSSPSDYAITDRNLLTTNASVPMLGDESWHLTKEEHVMQSAFQVPSEKKRLFGHIKSDIVIEETSSDHPKMELLPSESDVAESHPLSFKELDQPSPVSVLEAPSEDETYGSGCFERLSADLKELRMQLQLLKLESLDTYAEETEVLMLSDEDCTGDSHVLLPSGKVHQQFIDDDDRDFTYLLDMLIESGIRGVGDNKLLDACYLLGCPVDQHVFNKLEKKHDRTASWSRSERKLLFDLINCTLAGLVIPCMDVHPSLTSKICPPAWDREGLIESLWQMVVKQRKELDCDQKNKVLEPGWFALEYDVNLIGREIERMLNDDLLEELAREFVLAELC